MYRLRRIHLRGLGPADARFDPLTIDLTRDGTSDHTAIWLANGGGKTTLLRLVFHALRGAQADKIGRELSGGSSALAAALQQGDTGHVVLEWERPSAGLALEARPDLLLTGMVCEWPAGRAGTVLKDLGRTFYTLSPEPGLDLDTVIAGMTDGRRRIGLRAFVTWLRERANDHALASVVVIEGVRRWEDHLLALGLDTALLGYQIEMNRGEGGADGLLENLQRPDQVIRFLLGVVTADTSLKGLDDQLAAVAEKLARRPQLEGEKRLAAQLREGLERLAGAVAATDVAHTDHRRADEAINRLGQGLQLAVEARRAAHQQLTNRRAAWSDELTFQEAQRGQANRRVNGLRRWVAGEGLRIANERSSSAAEAFRLAAVEVQAHDLVGDVVRRRDLGLEAREIRRLLDDAERELEPVRTALSRTLDELLGALDELVVEAADRVREADAATRTADAEREGHVRVAGAARASAAGAETTRRVAESEAATHRRRLQELRDDVTLIDGETTEEGLTRWDARVSELVARLAEIDAERTALRARRTALTAEQRSASAREQEARGDLRALSATRTRHEEEEARILALPVLRELDRPVVDLGRGAEDLVAVLEGVAARAHRQIIAIDVEATSEDEARRHVTDHGVLPSRTDVQRVVAHLRRGGISADDGGRYLERAVPTGERSTRAADDPLLADAVVATGDRERVAEVLASLDGPLDHAVAIVPPGAAATTGFAVGGHPGRWDRAAAAVWVQAADERAAERDLRRAAFNAEEKRATDAATAVRRHLGDWDTPSRERHAAQERQAQDRLDAAIEATRTLQDELEELDPALEALDARRSENAGLRGAAERHAASARRALGTEAAEAAVTERARHARSAAAADQEAARAADAAADAAAARRDAARDRATAARQLETERRTIRAPYASRRPAGATDAPTSTADDRGAGGTPTADRRTVDALRRAVDDLDGELRRRTPAPERRNRLSAVETEIRELTVRLDAASEAAERAAVLAPAGSAHDAAGLRVAHADAVLVRDRIADEAAVALGAVEVAKAAVAEARSLGEGGAPDPVPADVAHGRSLLAEAERDRDGANAAIQRANEQLRETADAANGHVAVLAALDALAASLPADAVAPGPSSDDVERLGDPETARRLAGEAQKTVRDANAVLAARTTEQDEQHQRLRGILLETRTDGPGGRIVRDLLAASSADLAASAEHHADRLRQRTEMLDDALLGIDRDRRVVATTIAQEVDGALRTLGRIEDRSRLPEGLGPWSGQRVLRFRGLRRPRELAEIVSKIEASLSRLTATDGRAVAIPRGVDLLVRGVLDTVDVSSLDVLVLKPVAGAPGDPQPIEHLPSFSGGQRATIAILLYATLARVRRDELHRRGGDAGVSTLFLDNPLGKASAGFLVEQQLAVAEANGIQLVVATGVRDLDALDRFPVTVRLRNRAMLGRALRRIDVDDATLTRLIGTAETDGLEGARQTRAPTRVDPAGFADTDVRDGLERPGDGS